MLIHKDSHLDHGLTAVHLRHLLARYAARDGFFIETHELPAELPALPCALYGRVMGDGICGAGSMLVHAARRGDRPYESRVLRGSPRPSRLVTVIAGPHEEKCRRCAEGVLPVPEATPCAHPLPCLHCVEGTVRYGCILYTAFGGPLTPKEPGDPTLREEEREVSEAFWREHALAID